MKLEHFQVSIDRGNGCTLTQTVPFFMFDLLSAVHNTETDSEIIQKVHKIGESFAREMPEDFDPEETYGLLMKGYGGKEGMSIVKSVWRSARDFEREVERNEMESKDLALKPEETPEPEYLNTPKKKNKGGRPKKTPQAA
jgi:hypothetical protein